MSYNIRGRELPNPTISVSDGFGESASYTGEHLRARPLLTLDEVLRLGPQASRGLGLDPARNHPPKSPALPAVPTARIHFTFVARCVISKGGPNYIGKDCRRCPCQDTQA